MKRLFKFKYPKIAIFILVIIASYFIFKNPAVSGFLDELGSLSYFGIFFAGILLAFGFSAPLAVGFFLTLSLPNIWLAVLIGSFGAVLSDLLIFNFIRISFQDEFNRLKHTKAMKSLSNLMEKEFGHKLKIYFMYLFAEILILTPLPDEAGIAMLAGLTKIKQFYLALISFAMHALSIYILLSI